MTYVTPTKRYVPEVMAVCVSLVRAMLPKQVDGLRYAVRMGGIGGNAAVNSHFLHLGEEVKVEIDEEFDGQTYTMAAFMESVKKDGDLGEQRELFFLSTVFMTGYCRCENNGMCTPTSSSCD